MCVCLCEDVRSHFGKYKRPLSGKETDPKCSAELVQSTEQETVVFEHFGGSSAFDRQVTMFS